MTTISKFYLHDAATSNTGTMPGAGTPFFNDSTGDATGARTARAANDTIGALQTSSLITATANTSLQNWGHRRFVSAPLAAHTFAAADGNWTFSFAAAESNTNHNSSITISLSTWRPSTGLIVSSGLFSSGASLSSTSETVHSVSVSTLGTTSIIDGDILIIEITDRFTQSMSSAYTSTFYYDGTTEASATSCASFVTPPSALTLFTASAHSLIVASRTSRNMLLRR
jgi:hypothetical protein